MVSWDGKTQSLPRYPLPMPGLSLSSRQRDEDRARLQGCGGMSQMLTGEGEEGPAWLADWVCRTWQLGLWSRHSAWLARLSLQFRQTAGVHWVTIKRRQIVQELFAWIFNTAAVCTIKHPDIWVTLGSRSHAYTFKDVSNYRSVQW